MDKVNEEIFIPPNQWYCKYCKRKYFKSDKKKHKETRKHQQAHKKYIWFEKDYDSDSDNK